MEIYLLDIDPKKTTALQNYFRTCPEIKIVTEDFTGFMKTHDVECIVSPANAFGLMDGGYDAAITDFFGEGLQKKVQERILNEYYGQQPLATALTVPIDDKHILIHVPTMMVPSKIQDPFIIYQSMRVTLMEAINQKVQSIVIPMFGGLTGRIQPDLIAKLMYAAYRQITRPNAAINWDEAYNEATRLERMGYKFE